MPGTRWHRPNGSFENWALPTIARKLTTFPQRITDADIQRLQAHYADAEVAEIVFVVCQANWFDRFTEALHLPTE